MSAGWICIIPQAKKYEDKFKDSSSLGRVCSGAHLQSMFSMIFKRPPWNQVSLLDHLNNKLYRRCSLSSYQFWMLYFQLFFKLLASKSFFFWVKGDGFEMIIPLWSSDIFWIFDIMFCCCCSAVIASILRERKWISSSRRVYRLRDSSTLRSLVLWFK